jgi:MoxR-like ATPase
VKSDSRARELLYEFDAVSRFHRTQPSGLGAEPMQKSAPLPSIASAARNELWKYVTKRELWLAFEGGPHGPTVLLIDEIDKAPRDFPNDLLRELEDLQFTVAEIDPPDNIVNCEPEKAPIVVITSNSERRLPEPFLRRCVYHHIEMTDKDVSKIVERRLSKLETTYLRQPFLGDALHCFLAIRSNRQLDKRPAIDEFWTWLEPFEDSSDAGGKRRKTIADAAEGLRAGQPVSLASLPAIGCLVKTTDDFAKIGQV